MSCSRQGALGVEAPAICSIARRWTLNARASRKGRLAALVRLVGPLLAMPAKRRRHGHLGKRWIIALHMYDNDVEKSKAQPRLSCPITDSKAHCRPRRRALRDTHMVHGGGPRLASDRREELQRESKKERKQGRGKGGRGEVMALLRPLSKGDRYCLFMCLTRISTARR